MKRILLAAVTVLSMSSFAVAEPLQLTSSQMDSVTAGGWRFGNINVQIALVKQSATATALAEAKFGKAVAIAVAKNESKVEQRIDND